MILLCYLSGTYVWLCILCFNINLYQRMFCKEELCYIYLCVVFYTWTYMAEYLVSNVQYFTFTYMTVCFGGYVKYLFSTGNCGSSAAAFSICLVRVDALDPSFMLSLLVSSLQELFPSMLTVSILPSNAGLITPLGKAFKKQKYQLALFCIKSD